VYAYRARKYNAIPEDADLKLIREIYCNCPDEYHVDHIIALASGGKHHQDNLQYLPINENCRKGKTQNYDKSLALDWRNFK
jgi:5-methylcytosine-specific restriction endonuclease McrA